MALLRPLVLEDLFKMHHCNLDKFTQTFQVSYYLDYLAKWPHLCKAIEDRNGQVEGYILGKVEASRDPPPVPPYSPTTNTNPNYLPWHGHITALSIAQSARRLGHATVLSEAVERGSDVEDAWFVDLFVKVDNTPAQELYRKLGYSVYRRVMRYYGKGDDALDMRKPLSRDFQRLHIRENGADVLVSPRDVG